MRLHVVCVCSWAYIPFIPSVYRQVSHCCSLFYVPFILCINLHFHRKPVVLCFISFSLEARQQQKRKKNTWTKQKLLLFIHNQISRVYWSTLSISLASYHFTNWWNFHSFIRFSGLCFMFLYFSVESWMRPNQCVSDISISGHKIIIQCDGIVIINLELSNKKKCMSIWAHPKKMMRAIKHKTGQLEAIYFGWANMNLASLKNNRPFYPNTDAD